VAYRGGSHPGWARHGRLTPKLWLFAQAQIPAVQHLLGEQEVKPTYTGGMQLQVF